MGLWKNVRSRVLFAAALVSLVILPTQVLSLLGAGSGLLGAQVPGNTVTLEGYLKKGTPQGGDVMGAAVAISGDLALVGIPGHTPSGKTDAGRVLAFKRNGSTWTLVPNSPIRPVVEDSGDVFGTSVAISGNLIVVGAPRESSGATGVGGNASDNSSADSGAAYVYEVVGDTFVARAYLKPSNTGSNDRFGVSVAIDGNTIVVSAPQEDSNAVGVDGDGTNNSAVDSGAAYVFTLDNGVWSQQAYLKPSNTAGNDRFGGAIALHGDTMVLGARLRDDGGTDAGAAYVFTRSGTTWSQQAYLTAPTPAAGDHFGESVAIAADTIAVSSPKAGDGVVYMFNRVSGSWSLDAELTPTVPVAGADFGHALAMVGDRLAVGAHLGPNERGSAYVFARRDGLWSQGAVVESPEPGNGDRFGESVAISGNMVAVGAPRENNSLSTLPGNDSANDAGAGYTFSVALPAADPGTQTAFEATSANGAIVTLDGTGSSDANGRTLSYAWTRISGTPEVVGYSAIVTTEVALGTHTFRLDVDNGDGGTSAALLEVSVDDTTAPTISIVNPQAASYDPWQTVAVSFSCQDNVGVTSCAGTQPNGSMLPTTGGTYQFTVNAADANGNLSTSSVTWTRKKVPQLMPPSPMGLTLTYPTPIGPAQLAATALDPVTHQPVAGTFTFVTSGTTLSLGTVLNANNYTVTFGFVPADPQAYTSPGGFTFNLTVAKATTVVTWPTPLPMALGLPLSGVQPAPTANTAGVFLYHNPFLAGLNQTVYADFMPANPNWTSVTASTTVDVHYHGAPTYLAAAELTGPAASAIDFGTSIAISGTTMVVGAPQEDSTASNSGAAYVYTKSSVSSPYWGLEATLKASNAGGNDAFGTSVAISGDTILVGAPLEDSSNTTQSNNNASNAGAVYVFTRSGSTWTQQKYMKASSPAAGDQFGSAVAIDGNHVTVGAPETGQQVGAVHFFTRSGTTWTSRGSTDHSSGSGARFGAAIAMSAGTLAVGAPQAGSGDVSLYTYAGTSWSLLTSLSAPTEVISGFGSALAVTSGSVLVGVSEDSGPAAESAAFTGGAARMYEGNGSSWSETAFIRPPMPTSGTDTGVSVALTPDTAVVTGADGAGAVWVRSSGQWLAHDTMIPTGVQGEPHPVAIYHHVYHGDFMLVGAPMPSSGAGRVKVFQPQ